MSPKQPACPTINKQLYTWGTTEKNLVANNYYAPLTNDNSKLFDSNYLKSSHKTITTPYHSQSKSITTKPIRGFNSSGYGWNSAHILNNSFPQQEVKRFNQEYQPKTQDEADSYLKTPTPIIIPNYALKVMNNDLSLEKQKTQLDIIKTAEIIAESKKGSQNQNQYQYWLDIVATLKKIDLIKTRRDLIPEEVDIENQLTKIIT